MNAVEPDEPHLWDEDRVVLEVCTKPNSAFTRVPNRARLEQPLRDNNINGEFLLELDLDTLKTELGIASLGQRKAVMKGIELLRPGQVPFTMEERVRRFQEGLQTPDITHSRLSRLGQSPVYSANEHRPFVQQEIAPTPVLAPPQYGASSTIAPMYHERQYDIAAPKRPLDLLRRDGAPVYAASLPGLIEENAINSTSRADCASAIQVGAPLDRRPSGGRSRWSLQGGVEAGPADFLDILEKNIDQEPERESSLPSRQPAEPLQESMAQPKLQKRIAPTFIGHLEKPKPNLRITGLESLKDGAYYGSAAVPIQDTFYGSDSATDNEAFEIISSKPAAGYRGAIASRMQHYLHQAPVSIPNTRLVAHLPYTAEQCFGPASEHLFTLLPPNSDPIVQRIADWPSLSGDKPSASSKERFIEHKHSTQLSEPAGAIGEIDAAFAFRLEAGSDSSDLGDLAGLLERHPVPTDHDEGLPVYGDSEDDDGFDEETWQEIEAEQVERLQVSNAMPTEEVVATIDASLNYFEQQWNEHKLLKVQAKAYQLWMRAAKLMAREPERDIVRRSLRRCEARLEKLKDAITSDVWHKAIDVQAQCHSMEETANTIYECRYMLEVLNQDTAPPKPDKHALTRKPKPRIELPVGEEVLDSDDDINAFVVDDSSSAEDIPYAPEDDFNPVLTTPPPAPVRHQKPSEPLKPRAEPQVRAGPDPTSATGDEADVESNSSDKIISPTQKRRKIMSPVIPHKQKQGNFAVTADPILLPSYSESESDSDLDAPPKLPKTKYKSRGHSETQAIDLTFSDPLEFAQDPTSSEFDVKTPPLNPDDTEAAIRDPSVSARASKTESTLNSLAAVRSRPASSIKSALETETQLPAKEDVDAIRKLDWMEIENDSDRIRALFKRVYIIPESEFRELRACIGTIRHRSSRLDQTLKDGLMSLRNQEGKLWKINSKDHASVQLLTILFMTFVCCKGLVDPDVPSEADFNFSYEGIKTASTSFLTNLEQACQVYNRFLTSRRTNKRGSKRKLKEVEMREFIVEDSSSDVLAPGEQPSHSQTYKKRKRAVAESQEAKTQQKTDQQRVQEQEARREAMESKFRSMTSDGTANVYVNTEEPFIPLDPHIAGRVKPHQVVGIRFLWREIIEDPKHQGCLLAHTMGLGKTMQIISLLVTIAQCNQSDDPKINAYIPHHLRRSQTLILCPPTLLDNWYDELVMWLPRSTPTLLGPIRKISSSSDVDVQVWALEGGVLIMSYDLFRTMLKPSKNRKVALSDRVLAQREELLLEKANIVVADEAHKMKNAKAAITQVAHRIKTRSRIALTGSPLNNHLEEYHTMVDWIAPGYLGAMVQFRAKYVEPINQGLYAESTAYERRVCLKKLHVLKQDLAPKVNRADISAISKDLPSKTEYFITLPMTDLQRQAYDIYVGHMITIYGPAGRSLGKGLFSLISILLRLCNHPSIFVNKFERRQARQEEVPDADEETDTREAPLVDGSDAASSPEADAAPDIDAASPTETDLSAMDQAVKVFQDVQATGGLEDARLSYRAVIVQEILRRSIARGDKSLLFSHSLDTLDYLGSMLDQMGCHHMRIDGKTPMSRRQDITKQFNKSDSKYQVCLVSTKASGLGLNFQGASRVIIYDFGFNPMWEEQAVGRAYRLGQKQQVHVYRFRIGGTVEEVVNNKAVFKTQLFSRVVDKKNPMRYASNKASDYLFLSKEVEQRDFDECIGKDPDVLDKIIAENDKIRNIELTETFHKEDDEQLNEQELKEANEEWDRQRLQRDDPVAFEKKYGASLQPAQRPTVSNMLGFQMPQASPFAGANVHQPPSIALSQARGPQALLYASNPQNFSDQLANIANSMVLSTQRLGYFGPTESSIARIFSKSDSGSRGNERPGAPSPPSIVGSPPAAQDAPTPGGNSGNEKTMATNPPGCNSQ